MSIKTSELWAKSLSYGGRRSDSQIRWIVIHYTGNTTDTARGNANFFSPSGSNTRAAGAHYFVDENEVVQSIGDHRVAWSVGGSKYPNCGRTGGGKYFGIVNNFNSISIEMCSTRGAIAEKTIENTIVLTKQLMKQFNIDADHVVRHFDVTGKDCPGWNGWNGYSNSAKWEAFKRKLKSDILWFGRTTKEVKVHEKARRLSRTTSKMSAGRLVAVVEETDNWVLRKHGGWVPKKYIKRS